MPEVFLARFPVSVNVSIVATGPRSISLAALPLVGLRPTTSSSNENMPQENLWHGIQAISLTARLNNRPVISVMPATPVQIRYSSHVFVMPTLALV